MGRKVILQVSQQALAHNIQVIRRLVKRAKIMTMVKANAYGHGLAKVAKTIADKVDALGVACLDEAMTIRAAGVQTDVVLMEGIFSSAELPLVVQYDFTLVVHHWAQIQALQAMQAKPLSEHSKIKVWLKINTGMNRLGFSPQEFADAYSVLSTLPTIRLLGFMTHFANADQKTDPLTQVQYEIFQRLVADLPGEHCLANSAAILSGQIQGDWARPGLMLYGVSPFKDSTGKDFDLIPAMNLRSEIIAIRDLEKGEKVGYGGTWENKQAQARIGVVAFGYGDGYPWHAETGTPIVVNGQRTHIVGRVSMDMLTVNLAGITGVEIGSPVVLWGQDLAIEEVASHASTIPYELLCRFTERVQVQLVS